MTTEPSGGRRPNAGAWMLAGALALAGTSTAAQDSGPDLGSMTLEDLLEQKIIPVDVLGTHTHIEGEWMVSYHFSFGRMEGSRDGTRRLSDAEVLEQFPVTPTEMTMEMHMLHVMHAPSPRLTLMAMVPYTKLSMDHVTRSGARFTTRSEGLGDVVVEALVTAVGDVVDDHDRLLLVAGVGLPTGSIDERDATPAGPAQKLPYPMQLGSGTTDLRLGAAWVGRSGHWAWLTEARGIVRLGTNDAGYTLGDRLHATVSGSRRIEAWLGLSFEVEGQAWGDLDGADADLNPAIVPTADPLLRAGKRLIGRAGVDAYVPSGFFEGNRFTVRFSVPLVQSLDGPQLETDWGFEAGWSWTF